MKWLKTRPLAVAVSLSLMLALLPTTVLAADAGFQVYVGGTELTGSADEPAYATTDGNGTVTPGGSEEHYNVKWDGETLTLHDANITGGYSYVDTSGDANSTAVFRDGDLEVVLVGENVVTGPDTNGEVELSNGISAMEDLTISGSGSLHVVGGYDAVTSHDGNIMILGGEITAEGGSSGISLYTGDLTVSGGEVTSVATGNFTYFSEEPDVAYGIYIYGDCTISGGKITTTGYGNVSSIESVCGMYVFGSGRLTITGGELTSAAMGEYGYRYGIDSFDGAVITGGAVTATGGYAGIFTHSATEGAIDIEGGVVNATTLDENGYGIYARTSINIKDGTVIATAAEDGAYGLYTKYNDITVAGGQVTATGKGAGIGSEEGNIVAAPRAGWQIAVTAGAEQDGAAAVDGSPFVAETVVSHMLDGMAYCSFASGTAGLPFTDVAADSWYYDGVNYVYTAGLMSGTGDGMFSPDMGVSRAAVTVSLWRMAGSPVVNYRMAFTDVNPEAWYGEAVRWAAGEGVAGGYGGGRFGPYDPVTWEQLAVMLWRYGGSPDASVDMDNAGISSWARQAMAWCVEQGIMDGDAASSPRSQVTRAQAAVTLQKFSQLAQ